MKKFRVTVNGNMYEVDVEEVKDGVVQPTTPRPAATPAPKPVTAAPKTPKAPVATGSGSITAPIPGVVLSLKVKVGDTVNANDVVAIVEAMKMENEITAPTSGTIKAIHVSEGAQVSTGEVIIEIG